MMWEYSGIGALRYIVAAACTHIQTSRYIYIIDYTFLNYIASKKYLNSTLIVLSIIP
jgi:hypothetical protein